jgi:hypothetical protein
MIDRFGRHNLIVDEDLADDNDDESHSDLLNQSDCCCCWQPQNLLILSMKNLKDPARITKSSHRDSHGRCQLTRINSANVLDEGLWIGGKATTRDSGIEIGTRCTQVHVLTVEDRYILLAI